MTQATTAVASARLAELEAVIERGQQTFIEVGQALLEIRDSRLYREHYGTFEAYCRERWGWSRDYGYKIMRAAKAVLDGDVDSCIQTEGQARAALAARAQPSRLAPMIAELEVAARLLSDPHPELEELEEAVDRLRAIDASPIEDCGAQDLPELKRVIDLSGMARRRAAIASLRAQRLARQAFKECEAARHA